MLKFNPTTPVKFYAKTTTYVSGQGQTTTWSLVASGAYSTFFCEWRGSFGDRALSAQALGVKDSAIVRTFYNPTLYKKLRTEQVIVIKNADATAIVCTDPEKPKEEPICALDKNNPNVYELWGGVDNVKEENRFIEFRVRRYEGV